MNSEVAFASCVYVKRNSRVDSSNDEEGNEKRQELNDEKMRVRKCPNPTS